MAKGTEKAVERCCGCGKPVENTASHMLIERVGAKKATRGARSKAEWGRMHAACFARMTGKPRDLLDVLEEKETELLSAVG